MTPIKADCRIPCIRLPADETRKLDGLERLRCRKLALRRPETNDDLLLQFISHVTHISKRCSYSQGLQARTTGSRILAVFCVSGERLRTRNI